MRPKSRQNARLADFFSTDFIVCLMNDKYSAGKAEFDTVRPGETEIFKPLTECRLPDIAP